MAFEGWSYNPDIGAIYNQKGRLVGSYTKGRGRIYHEGKTYYTSRVAWYLQTGSWPVGHVDHIDRDPLNDRWCNLRDVSQQENNMNKNAYHTSKTGVRGVYPTPHGFIASIQANGEREYLGTFNTIEAAKKVYDAAAKEKYGELYVRT